ncbi:MAG: MerR family transcriptional regulator [Paludibacteraceae bacterium]|nr:MerR family transcriptional regulator [Paludibacteraceae bacterium]
MDNEKIYSSLQEVITETGLPASTLYYWERQFPQINPRRDGHNNRYYKKEDIDFIKQIKFIRDDLKITRIEAIKREIADSRNNIGQRQQATELLQKIKTELLNIRSQL